MRAASFQPRVQLLVRVGYPFSTEAGTLPRSLTFNPAWRAHARTSALLGEPADIPRIRATAGAPVLDLVPADRFLLFTVLFWAGLLASGGSLETTRVTPYNAPRARIASSRGSLESTVSSTALHSTCPRRQPTSPPNP